MKKETSIKPIVLFYHLFATNDWKNICNEQVLTLQDAGLSQVSTIHVCISGPEKSDADAFLKAFDLKFIHCEFNLCEENIYEWSTLKVLWDMAQNDDAYYLYFHAKGVTQTGEKKAYVDLWRQYLNYFCMLRWQDCVHALETYADLAGCQYKVQTVYYPCHYSGNFWWATSNYIKSLPNPALFSGDRLEAEFWACRTPHKALNLWSTNICMYNNPLLPEVYKDKAEEPTMYFFTT